MVCGISQVGSNVHEPVERTSGEGEPCAPVSVSERKDLWIVLPQPIDSRCDHEQDSTTSGMLAATPPAIEPRHVVPFVWSCQSLRTRISTSSWVYCALLYRRPYCHQQHAAAPVTPPPANTTTGNAVLSISIVRTCTHYIRTERATSWLCGCSVILQHERTPQTRRWA